MKSTKIPIGQVKPNPVNPRLIKDEKFQKLVKSIQDFPEMLEIRPIVVNNDMIVLGGNMRLKACQAAGLKEVWILKADQLSEKQQREFIIKDNLGYGEWDYELIAKDWSLEELVDWGMDMPTATGNGEAEEDGYVDPGILETDIQPGDLFEIGRHRLLCGSSTSKEDVEKLLGGKEPYLMVTDPPYGVSYDPTWRHKAGIIDSPRTGKVVNDDQADWSEAWALSPARVAYVWHACWHASTVQNSLEKNNYELRSQIIWNKQQMVFSQGHYHWKHEPCWYAVKKGNKGNWAGDRKQTTVWDIQSILQSSKIKKEDEAQTHGTQKPVECMARPIMNHDGDVYDPFIGSGTTMVASEQLNRSCYAMEIDPRYCHIVIDRMEKLIPGIVI